MIDRQKDTWTDRNTDRLIDRHTQRQIDRQTHRQTDKIIDTQTDRRTGRKIEMSYYIIFLTHCSPVICGHVQKFARTL